MRRQQARVNAIDLSGQDYLCEVIRLPACAHLAMLAGDVLALWAT